MILYLIRVYNDVGDEKWQNVFAKNIEAPRKRLNIIEGQVRGVKDMVLEDRYCDEIMIQISAINKSLKSLGTEMLKNHLQTCIVDELKNDNLSAIDDVISLFDKLN